MPDFISLYLSNLIDLIADLWLWMLLGFFIAAFVQEFISSRRLLSHFGNNNLISLGKASIVGLFISVCSCGAIPLAATLRERGASTATTLTFLLATPWAGFIHLFIIATFVGVENTIILFVFSLIVALIAGVIFSFLENRGFIAQPLAGKGHIEGEKFKCEECIQVEELKHRNEPLVKRFFVCIPRNMWHIFLDIGKYIVFGLVIAAVLATSIPTEAVSQFLGEEGGLFFIPPIILAVPISAIIELCAEGFTILAGQLYSMGATLAVVFVMMMVGVTTDLTEISMLWGKFGKRTALAYLITSTLLVIIFAFIINSI